MNQRSEERAAAQQSEEEAAGASDPSTWKLMRVFSRRQEKREAVCLPSSSVITDCSIDAFNGLHSSTSPAFLSSSPLTYFSCAGRLFDFFFFPFTSSAHFFLSIGCAPKTTAGHLCRTRAPLPPFPAVPLSTPRSLFTTLVLIVLQGYH